ncbi:MAG: hypothetical protein F6K19_19520, partial [Cyanothece sp. SIO1E1]|nr:hypothetical protein [Cyanothece sp. SIO1E1]
LPRWSRNLGAQLEKALGFQNRRAAIPGPISRTIGIGLWEGLGQDVRIGWIDTGLAPGQGIVLRRAERLRQAEGSAIQME